MFVYITISEALILLLLLKQMYDEVYFTTEMNRRMIRYDQQPMAPIKIIVVHFLLVFTIPYGILV